MAQVDTVAAHRDPFPEEQIALTLSHRDGPVGTDYAMPWETFMGRGKNATDQARRSRLDIAISPDKSNGNRAYPTDDARGAGIEAFAVRRHRGYIVCHTGS
jgi:hypothetical protein